MKYQVLFSLKNNEKFFMNVTSAAVMIGALRVKVCFPPQKMTPNM